MLSPTTSDLSARSASAHARRPEASRGAEALLLFSLLPGRWAIDRGFSTGERFSGRAVIAREGDRGLSYEEHGTLTLPSGERFEARRRYAYELRGASLEVHFRGDAGLEGLFHQIDPTTGEGTHFCDPDLYEAKYSFESDDRFRIHYRVTGPRKDYVSDTVFVRETMA